MVTMTTTRRRRRRMLAGAAAAPLALPVLAPVPGSAVEADVEDSAAIDVLLAEQAVRSADDPGITGTIVGGSGDLSGFVVARLEPSMEQRALLRDGDTFTTHTVAAAAVDANGDYTLRIPRSDAFVTSATSANGRAVLELQYRSTDGTQFSVGRAEVVVDRARAERSAAGTGASGGRAVPTETVAPFDLPAHAGVGPALPELYGSDQELGCTTTMINSSYQVDATVVRAAIGALNVTVDPTYTVGASSQLGYAVKAAGSGWQVGWGTTTHTQTNTSVDFESVGLGNWNFRAPVEMQYYSKRCSGQVCGATPTPPQCSTTYFASPIGMAGGVGPTLDVGGRPINTYCTNFNKGSITYNSSQASTYSNGLKISQGGFGIDVSAQTGYSTSTSITFTNPNTGRKYLCGRNALPGNPNFGWIMVDFVPR